MQQLILSFEEFDPDKIEGKKKPDEATLYGQIKVAIDELTPDQKGRILTFANPDDIETARIYAHNYVTKQLRPSDWYIRTHRISNEKLAIWKKSGQRDNKAQSSPYRTRQPRKYKYSDLHRLLDGLQIDDTEAALVPCTDAIDRERKGSEISNYAQRINSKERGFVFRTKTVKDKLFVWKEAI